jgi:signal transduction histidine kinase/DNA-binding response OmpR family regulator
MIVQKFIILLLAILFCGFASADEKGSAQELLYKIERMVVPNPKEAQTLIEHAALNKEIMASDSLKSHYFNLLAYVAIMKADHANAIVYLEKAKTLAIQSNNYEQEAESYRREGILLLMLGQHAEALSILNKALFIHDQIESPKVTIAITGILNIYNKLGQNQKLKDYSLLLLEKATEYELYSEIANAHYLLNLVFIKEENIEQARFHVNALYEATALDDFPHMFLAHTASAELLQAEGKSQEALEQIRLATAFVEQSNISAAFPHLFFIESELLFDLNQETEALQVLDKVMEITKVSNEPTIHLKAINKLAEYYENNAEYQRALALRKQYQTFKDKTNIDNERKLLTISQAKLDVSVKDIEIKDLKLEQELTSQQKQNQINITILTIIAAIALAIFSFHLFRQKRKLRETYNALELASSAKSQFLARMSHEIRTPINAIIGLTKLSLKASQDKDQTTNLQQIEESSQTLLGVINDVLDYSKIEAQALLLSNVVFDIEEVVNRALRLHSLKAVEKNVELISFISREVPLKVKGDPLRLQQILNNLISNAIKFTPSGSVAVTVKRQYKKHSLMLEFEVKDTGIGIELSKQTNLFDSFSQADESITRSYGGTGLGLAISKQLVELMGGSISLNSEPGQGTTFSFTSKFEESLETPLNKLTPAVLAKLKVLVVDDLEISRQSLLETLNSLNIQPDLADSASLCMDMIRIAMNDDTPYDLIILDWKMPDVDGIEVASVIRQECIQKQPAIIMFSSYDIATLAALGKPLGIHAFLEKPVTSSQLIEAISGESIQSRKTRLDITSPISVPNLNDKHILLVEDNLLNKKVALAYLSETGVKVSWAENGEIAIQTLLNDNTIDLILMDIQMPVMDGLTATQKIRSELSSKIPIIAMTAHAMIDEVEKSLAMGMNAHVAKPINPEQLFDSIQKLLGTVNKTNEPNSNPLPILEIAKNDESLLTIETQKAITSLRIDENSYQELVDDFIRMCQGLTIVSAQKSAEDFDAISKALHTLGPSLTYIGAYSLATFSDELEQAILERDLTADTELEERIELFKSSLDIIVKHLSNQLS